MTESQSARRTETDCDDGRDGREHDDGSGPLFRCEGCGGWVPETRYCNAIRVAPDGTEEDGYLGPCCHPRWRLAGEVDR